MNKIIVVDLDGTIADLSHRLHYIQGENKDYKSFYDEVDKDQPIEDICELIEKSSKEYQILFLTGRNEICFKKTYKWIDKYVGCSYCCYNLLMRKQSDRRPDTEVKPELLKEYLKENQDSEVAFILDDRNPMVKKWRELGFTCLQVADGDF